jgi:hypothetical protein
VARLVDHVHERTSRGGAGRNSGTAS